MTWNVYILECADGTLYTGITRDLDRRILEHEKGRGSRYTRGRGPFLMVHRETCQGRGPATRRELEIKALDREQKLALIAKNRQDNQVPVPPSSVGPNNSVAF